MYSIHLQSHRERHVSSIGPLVSCVIFVNNTVVFIESSNIKTWITSSSEMMFSLLSGELLISMYAPSGGQPNYNWRFTIILRWCLLYFVYLVAFAARVCSHHLNLSSRHPMAGQTSNYGAPQRLSIRPARGR